MVHPLCIYFRPAAGPSSLSWCVCVCICVSERASVKGDVGRGGYAHFLLCVFPAAAGFRHMLGRRRPLRMSRSTLTHMSVPLHTVARAEEAVDVESGNSSRRQNTLTRHPAKADMFGYRLVAKVAIVFEGKLPLLTDGGWGGGRRSAAPLPHPCSVYITGATPLNYG